MMITTNRILPLILLAIISIPVTTFSQDENVRGVIRTANGYMVVWNQPDNNFTLEVKGTKFEQVPNKNLAFLVDDKFLEIVTADTKDILAESGNKKIGDDKEMLTVHREWETQYLEKSTNSKLPVDSEFITVAKNRSALLWSFAMPKSAGGEVERQFFLTLRNGGSIIVLNGASTKAISAETVRNLLIETASTINIRKKPLTREEAVELAKGPQLN